MAVDGALRVYGSDETVTEAEPLARADEINELLKSVQAQIIPFIQAADREIDSHKSYQGYCHEGDSAASCLVKPLAPAELQSVLPLDLPTIGRGASGFLSVLGPVLQYSVNTFAPGFLDKLFASTNAPGLASDLVLSALNTNLHVFQVSPALSLIERHTAKALAALFGLTGPRAGGISVQGGSASNATSIVVARNTLYPNTKIYGNSHDGHELVLFTSAHGHYSIEKAAQMCGFGSQAVIAVDVDPITGAMSATALESAIVSAKSAGKSPFYVNATAGTTVLGSFDPFSEIAAIARRHKMWFHIDGSWGGPFVFSSILKAKLVGSDLADSIAINPHKMMGVPVTCSFLLAKDLRQVHRANTLPAGYLFHGHDEDHLNSSAVTPQTPGSGSSSSFNSMEASSENNDDENKDDDDDEWNPPNDLADLTLQCGRRGDSLKLFLSWQYYGSAGYASQIENAHSVASHFASLLAQHPDAILVSQNPPPCLQVCFYFAPGGKMVFDDKNSNEEDDQAGTVPCAGHLSISQQRQQLLLLGRRNSSVTENIARALVRRGFMIDFAPSLEGHEARGHFFRVVVSVQTRKETVERLVQEVMSVGWLVREQLLSSYQVVRKGADV